MGAQGQGEAQALDTFLSALAAAMLPYIIRRLLLGLPLLAAVITLVFE